MEVISVAPLLLVIIFIISYFLILNSNLDNTGILLFEKVVVSILSALLISFFLAYSGYTPVESREAGILYESFQGLFMIYLFTFFPVYLVYGTILSFFIDINFKKMKSKNLLLNYLIKLISYAFGGIFIIGLFLIFEKFTSPGNVGYRELYLIYTLGILPSLLLYHVSLLVKLFKKTLKLIGNLIRWGSN